MADDYTIPTELGDITFSDTVIDDIVMRAAKPFLDDDRLFFDRRRGINLPRRAGKGEEITGVEVEEGEDGLHITVPVILRFGTSISQAADTLIEGIRRGFLSLTGEEPASVTVLVTGTMSKQLVRREIEVRWERESR